MSKILINPVRIHLGPIYTECHSANAVMSIS